MEFHGIPIGSLWTIIKFVPSFFLKRIFPKSRLAELIYIDLRPRHEPATVDLGESASFEIWINVINLSPFEVELDRGEFRFVFGGVDVKSYILKKQIIRSGEIALFRIAGTISDGHANQIARTTSLNPETNGWLEGHVEFNCNLHPFGRGISNLSEIRPRLRNAHFRVGS